MFQKSLSQLRESTFVSRSMMLFLALVLTGSFFAATLSIAPTAVAQGFISSAEEILSNTGLTVYGQNATDDSQTLADKVGGIINVVLGFLGIIFLILIIYAGFLWMTAAGNDDAVGRAKKILINSTIGLVIVIAAYTISSFIFNAIQQNVLTP
ncbi:MAG: hypothetical protein COT39_03855 [Parcubacteria group bacterium CG08_land_8_20_14_0_20_48_21]|nr:MAG: hypothetical protein AUK21_01075 [Parcubacteria group bacterium CG2_30_48_51]PIS32565.1 MAG: hypothetical protein COT39_03855 [Parcubacteria group bacterium CG08_land_8_20_14_0_20_48_21]PIW78970.1 MAG: hypothetical protein COZ99_03515 [Parcubacteria group bacterium CG_4_8_14_3_um_filter_48_16]PJC39577.1 MAG: hypothetical protein CO043_03480 [Parcubacteria group bacterium CG_4_9_14_0_2_um_filter_48_40]